MQYKQIRRRQAIFYLGGAALPLSLTARAQSTSYPSRPVRIIVPWAAGGGGDVMVRLLGTSLSRRLGQPVVVDNRTGAIGTIGSTAAAHSPADGYTLLYATMDSHAIAPHVLKKSPYDALRDFVPIAPLGSFPVGLVVNGSSSAKTLDQFIDMAKMAKEPLTFGSWSTGTAGHLMMEALKQTKNINMLHVPYNGTAPLLQAQLARQIDSSMNVLSTVEPHMRTGALRVLAVSAQQRLPDFPDIPTMKELGVSIDRGPWAGIFGPAGIPQDLVTRLHDAIDASLREPAIVEQSKRMFFIIDHSDQRAYQSFYASEVERWGEYVRMAKITID